MIGMRTYRSARRVHHSADDMFALVADVERYPEFVPLCRELTVLRRERDGNAEIVIASMTVSYQLLRESFTSRVRLDKEGGNVLVEYLDGPFRHLENRWTFQPLDASSCDVDFYIAYEFRSPLLQAMMGHAFGRAFQKFVAAFEERADIVYGKTRRHEAAVSRHSHPGAAPQEES